MLKLLNQELLWQSGHCLNHHILAQLQISKCSVPIQGSYLPLTNYEQCEKEAANGPFIKQFNPWIIRHKKAFLVVQPQPLFSHSFSVNFYIIANISCDS